MHNRDKYSGFPREVRHTTDDIWKMMKKQFGGIPVVFGPFTVYDVESYKNDLFESGRSEDEVNGIEEQYINNNREVITKYYKCPTWGMSITFIGSKSQALQIIKLLMERQEIEKKLEEDPDYEYDMG
jgi:hypothetical protein